MLNENQDKKDNKVQLISLALFTVFLTPLALLASTLFPELNHTSLSDLFVLMIAVALFRGATQSITNNLALKIMTKIKPHE